MMYQRSNLMSDNNCVGLNGTVVHETARYIPGRRLFLINLNTGQVCVWLLIKSNERLTVVYHHDVICFVYIVKIRTFFSFLLNNKKLLIIIKIEII